MRQQTPYLHALTCARGLAAWMVVLFHVRGSMPWLPDGIMAVASKGYLAVDFFFLLSGFVIFLSAHRAFTDNGWRATIPFLRRRLARIYPLYAVMLALCIAFALLLEMTGRDTSGYPWSELPVHVAMLQNWGFTGALSWNHPAWSISTESAAYLLFPLFASFVPIMRMSRPLLLAGALMLIGIMAAWLHAAGLNNLGEDIPHYGLVRCLFEFAAGCLLCALWLKGAGRPARAPIAIAMMIGGAAVAAWTMDGRTEAWTFPAMAGAFIFLLAQWPLRLPDGGQWPPPLRALIYLGEISYATYLSHFMLFIWFKIALADNAANIAPGKIGLFLLLTLIASMLLYHLVEKPGRKLFARSETEVKKRPEPDGPVLAERGWDLHA